MTSTIRPVRNLDSRFAEKGKSEKKRAARTLPRKITRRADHCHTKGLPANALIVVLGLPSTSKSAASSANQSLDLPHVRQKITTPTPNRTTASATVSVALTVANEAVERPRSCSVCTLARLSCP